MSDKAIYSVDTVETITDNDKIYVNTGDNMKINGIYNCDLNGGGQLKEYSTNTIHTLLYFDITTRSQN